MGVWGRIPLKPEMTVENKTDEIDESTQITKFSCILIRLRHNTYSTVFSVGFHFDLQ